MASRVVRHLDINTALPRPTKLGGKTDFLRPLQQDASVTGMLSALREKENSRKRIPVRSSTSLPRLSTTSASSAAAAAWTEDAWVSQARPLQPASGSLVAAGVERKKPSTLRVPSQGPVRPRSNSGNTASPRSPKRLTAASRAQTPTSEEQRFQASTNPAKKERGDLDRLTDELEMPHPDFDRVEAWLLRLKKKDPKGLQRFFEQHMDVPSQGVRAVHKAARAGSAATVKAFVAAGGDVDLVSGLGWTALHYACDLGQGDMIKVLLQLGADVNKPTLGGTTPLMLACQRRSDSCVLEVLRSAPGYVCVEQEDSTRATARKMAKTPLSRWLIDYYKEYPSLRSAAAWNKEALIAALSRREEAEFGTALRMLFLDTCISCTADVGLALALPSMPMTAKLETLSFFQPCPGPNACRRACSVGRL